MLLPEDRVSKSIGQETTIQEDLFAFHGLLLVLLKHMRTLIREPNLIIVTKLVAMLMLVLEMMEEILMDLMELRTHAL
jgi:hypothetical protein